MNKTKTDNKNKLTQKNLKNFSSKFNKKKTNKVFKNVNTKQNFKNLILKSDYIQNKKQHFKNTISIDTKITNQKYSGRCWLFACLNIIRIPMIKKYKLENFEFSENYLFFYDKLEKANTFLNNIYKYKNKDFLDPKFSMLLKNITSDGGNWFYFINLIEKYGIIPKNNMEDHYHSENSDELNTFLNNYLLTAAKEIRDSKNFNKKLLNKILYNCYKILVIFLGEPPKKITWEYYEKNEKNEKNAKKYKVITNVTPIEFLNKYVPFNIKDKIYLINYPCKPYYKLYTQEINQSINDSYNHNYINVPVDVMINCVKKSINNKEAVYCGIDVDKFISRKHGILDTNAFNYKDIFGFDNTMEKCDAINYNLSIHNHAIIIRGYNSNKNSSGFLIENSWGEDNGFKGNYFMSLEWFKKYVYSIVVDKNYADKKTVDVLKKKPIILPFNDRFMGVVENI